MEQFFKDLYAAFEGAKQQFIDAGVTPVAVIDRFRGQPLSPEQFEYYPLPAIFVSWQTAWDEVQNRNGIVSWDFHIIQDATWETANIATNHEQGLQYNRLIDRVRKVLDNFVTPYTSKLKRSNDKEVDTGIIIYQVLGYKCAYYDNDGIDEDYTDSENDDLDLSGKLVTHLQ